MDLVPIPRATLRDEIISPLTHIYGELESNGTVSNIEDLEIVIFKLNQELKKNS